MEMINDRLWLITHEMCLRGFSSILASSSGRPLPTQRTQRDGLRAREMERRERAAGYLALMPYMGSWFQSNGSDGTAAVM